MKCLLTQSIPAASSSTTTFKQSRQHGKEVNFLVGLVSIEIASCWIPGVVRALFVVQTVFTAHRHNCGAYFQCPFRHNKLQDNYDSVNSIRLLQSMWKFTKTWSKWKCLYPCEFIRRSFWYQALYKYPLLLILCLSNLFLNISAECSTRPTPGQCAVVTYPARSFRAFFASMDNPRSMLEISWKNASLWFLQYCVSLKQCVVFVAFSLTTSKQDTNR